MPCAETASGEIFYTLSRGPAGGPVLVLVHGAGGTRLHWPGELRRLPGATVYTLDLPGHGRSGGRGCDTIEGYVEAVVAFLQRLRVERAVIVGHSMGGAIAQTLALSSSGQVGVAGLVLIATGARLRVAPAILDGIRSDFEQAAELITRFAWSPEAPSSLVERGRKTLLEADPDVVWGDFATCDRFDVIDRLGEIRSPTLVVSGSVDPLTPVKYARFLVERIPQARYVIVEGAGHMVMLEQPGKVMQVVQEFLVGIY